MIIRSKGTLTFHFADTRAKAKTAAKQHHKRGSVNCAPSKYPILSPYTDRFIPFTFHKTITGFDVAEILLISYTDIDATTYTGNVEIDLTSDTGLADLKTVQEYDSSFEEVLYLGGLIDTTLTPGQYWLQLRCSASEYFYSNVFIITA